jgi:Helix-turn-helix domain/RodZ C-terminal domain
MASFGDTLRREREMREISLREISDATKINIRYLEALEQNHFHILPGGLFNKGFIRAYAVYVGIDGEAMVTSYLHEIASRDQKSVAAQGEPPPELHRPAEAPRRRAGAGPETTPAGWAAPSRPAPAAAPSPGAAPPPPRFVEMTAAAPASEELRPETPARPRPAASPPGISLEGPAEPAAERSGSTRVLAGIVALVAGLAAIFLVLALVMPLRRRPTPASGDGVAGGAPVAADPSGVPLAARPAPAPATGSAAEPEAVVAGVGDGAAMAHPPPPKEPEQMAAFGSSPAAARPSPGAKPRPTPAAASPTPILRAPEPGIALKAAPEATPEPAGPMRLQVEATGRTWVQLTCDSRDAINWVMRTGDSETMECLRLIRVSAADAAAVRLTVNGASCMPLGDAGDRVYGYTIRSDDFRLICPPAGRGEHARD